MSSSKVTLPAPEPRGWSALPRGARIAIIVSGVLGALLLVAWLLLPTLAESMLRDQLPKLEERLGRKVDFGDLELHGLSGATLRDVVIYDADGAEPFLEVEALEVQLSASPIWGDFDVTSIDIRSPVLRVERDEAGRLSVRDIPKSLSRKKKKASSGSGGGSGEEKNDPLDPFPTITLSDGTLILEDASRKHFDLARLSGPFSAQVSAGSGDALALESALSLSFTGSGGETTRRRVELGGAFDREVLDASRLTLRIPESAPLPLRDGVTRYPGLRLLGLTLSFETVDQYVARVPVPPEQATLLKRARVRIEHALGPLRWSTEEGAANPAWIERLALWPLALDAVPLPEADPAHLATLSDSSVQAYTRGTPGAVTLGDIVPMKSSGEAYNQKWDFRAQNRDGWSLRMRFQVANLGFGNFKGQLTGKLYRREDGETVEELRFKQKFSESEWSTDTRRFVLNIGEDYRISGEPELGTYRLIGVAGKGEEATHFDFRLEGEGWKPGTGIVLFGKEEAYYKNTIMIMAGTARGTLSRGDSPPITTEPALAYADHIATNVEAHNMMDRSFYYRRHDGPWYIEWRHVITTQHAYDGAAFGYLVVARDGDIVFASKDLEVSLSEPWTDPGNLGYTISRRVRLSPPEGGAALELTNDRDVKVKDLLAKLPALERAVAEQFAKPFAYEVFGPWTLTLDGAEHTGSGSYTVTVLR